jgi:hypothetical protein
VTGVQTCALPISPIMATLRGLNSASRLSFRFISPPFYFLESESLMIPLAVNKLALLNIIDDHYFL